MILRDAIYWLKIGHPEARAAVAKQRNCMLSSVTVTDEITMDECKKLWESFPEHSRVMLISVTPDGDVDKADVNMLGDWDGRQMRVSDRLFKRAYKQYKFALAHGTENKRFRSVPNHEEILELQKQDRARVKARELAEELEIEEPAVEEAPVVLSPIVHGDPKSIYEKAEAEKAEPVAPTSSQGTQGIEFDTPVSGGVSTISAEELEKQGLN